FLAGAFASLASFASFLASAAGASFLGSSAIAIIGVARVPTIRAVRMMLRMWDLLKIGSLEISEGAMCTGCAVRRLRFQWVGIVDRGARRPRGANGPGRNFA